MRLLGQGVGTKQRFQLARPVAAPGKRLRQQPLDLDPGVDRVRVDRKTGRLLGKAAVLLGETQLVPYQVHQIGGVAAIEHREIGIEADRLGVQAQEAVADGMEGAGPCDCAGQIRMAPGADPFDPAGHLLGRAARECEQQNAPRVGPAKDQMSDAMRERVGLARARAGDDQERSSRRRAVVGRHIESDRGALRLVQALEVGRFLHARLISARFHRREAN